MLKKVKQKTTPGSPALLSHLGQKVKKLICPANLLILLLQNTKQGVNPAFLSVLTVSLFPTYPRKKQISSHQTTPTNGSLHDRPHKPHF